MTNRPTRLLWLDLEMTGLKPKTDLITEVAVIVTDINLNELAVYQSGVKHPEKTLRKLINENAWYKERPDHAKKIIEESLNGRDGVDVQKDIIGLIEKHIGLSKKPADFPFIPDSLEIRGEVYIAGNSIMSDRMFIEVHWPEVARVLHYRMLDVSSFKIWHMANGDKEFKKQTMHRALDDVRESIAELKYYSNL